MKIEREIADTCESNCVEFSKIFEFDLIRRVKLISHHLAKLPKTPSNFLEIKLSVEKDCTQKFNIPSSGTDSSIISILFFNRLGGIPNIKFLHMIIKRYSPVTIHSYEENPINDFTIKSLNISIPYLLAKLSFLFSDGSMVNYD